MRSSDWCSVLSSSDLAVTTSTEEFPPYPSFGTTSLVVTLGLEPLGFTQLARLSRKRYTYRCRPGACPRDPLALAQGDALLRLHPCSSAERSVGKERVNPC